MLKSVVLAVIATALTGLLFLWACLMAYRGNTFPPAVDGHYLFILSILWFEFLGWTNDALVWLQNEKRVRLLPFEFEETSWGTGIEGGPVEYLPVRDKVFRAYPTMTIILIIPLISMLMKSG